MTIFSFISFSFLSFRVCASVSPPVNLSVIHCLCFLAQFHLKIRFYLFQRRCRGRVFLILCSLCWPLVNGHKPVGADTRKKWRKRFSRDMNPTSSKRFSFPTLKMLWRLAFHLISFYRMNTFTICSSEAKAYWGWLTLSIRRIKHTWPYD